MCYAYNFSLHFKRSYCCVQHTVCVKIKTFVLLIHS